jgi:hypothetical protein
MFIFDCNREAIFALVSISVMQTSTFLLYTFLLHLFYCYLGLSFLCSSPARWGLTFFAAPNKSQQKKGLFPTRIEIYNSIASRTTATHYRSLPLSSHFPNSALSMAFPRFLQRRENVTISLNWGNVLRLSCL